LASSVDIIASLFALFIVPKTYSKIIRLMPNILLIITTAIPVVEAGCSARAPYPGWQPQCRRFDIVALLHETVLICLRFSVAAVKMWLSYGGTN
jgi:hypothetical protein